MRRYEADPRRYECRHCRGTKVHGSRAIVLRPPKLRFLDMSGVSNPGQTSHEHTGKHYARLHRRHRGRCNDAHMHPSFPATELLVSTPSVLRRQQCETLLPLERIFANGIGRREGIELVGGDKKKE